MLQLVQNPLIQRLFHDCPLLHRRDGCCCGGGCWWRLGLRRSIHRVIFFSWRSILVGSYWGLSVLLLYVLEPNTWAVERAGEQSGAVAAAEIVTLGTVGVDVAGVFEWKWGQDQAGRVYAEIGSGRQRGAAVPLGQQIRPPVDKNNKLVFMLREKIFA